jgi:two-component system sensor histidine kinase UhpB
MCWTPSWLFGSAFGATANGRRLRSEGQRRFPLDPPQPWPADAAEPPFRPDSRCATFHPVRPKRRVPLFWQIFVPNALLLVLAGLALTLSPATVSSPPLPIEAAVVAVGMALMLVINLFLLRWSVGPLEQLARLMRKVDPLRPGQRVRLRRANAEIDELADVFNGMLERLEAERRESARRTLAAEETERRRLARELHDQVGQTLTALMLEVGHAAGRAPEVRSELREAQEAARALSDDIREIVRRLRPEALDDLGLTSALTVLAEQFDQHSEIEVRRRFASPPPTLDPDVEVVVYRVAQESLTNVARHAGASHVEIALSAVEGWTRLEISDDGRGLNGATLGNGVRGMRERALLVGGRFALESPPAGGTSVRLDVPCASEASG